MIGLVVLAATMVTAAMCTVAASLIDVPERPRRRAALRRFTAHGAHRA